MISIESTRRHGHDAEYSAQGQHVRSRGKVLDVETAAEGLDADTHSSKALLGR